MADFSEILNKEASKVEKPKPLPEGTYLATIMSYSNDTVGQKETPACNVSVKMIDAMEDVSTDELPPNWDQKENRITFWLTEDAQYRFVNNFLNEALGLDIESKTIGELQEEMVGATFKVAVTQRQAMISGEARILNDYTDFAPAD